MMSASEALETFDNATDFESKIQVFCDYLTEQLTIKEKLKPRAKMEFKGGAIKNDRVHSHHVQRTSADQPLTTGGRSHAPTRIIRNLNGGSQWIT